MNFKTNNILRNNHIQTSYATLFRKPFLKNFKIEKFILSDGDFIEIYWHFKPKKDEQTPIIVLFHGLTGSFNSPYIQGAINELNKNDFACVVVHFRGCATEENLLARSYHSGETQDNLEYLQHLKKEFPNSKLFCIGYSLGGNMLLKLLGELKQNKLITAAVSVSAPMQLKISAKTINSGFSKFYQKRLLKDLTKALLRKYQKHDFEKLINLKKESIQNIQTLKEFDDIYTAPIHGFDSADDYYKKCSSKQFLKDIQTPTLIIHAKDDPFMSTEILPQPNEISKYITLEISENGGHVGFIQGSIFKPIYWLEKRITQYFLNYLRA
ncbi:hydrolase [Sulfurimonas sp.]